MGKYKPTIGLEIHAELRTKTKMFCDCLNDENQLEPNVNVCPVCLGHPGALPKANQKAIDYVIMTGLALGCDINHYSKFDRKNYFYPDLPKAYQISQYDLPLCKNGKLYLPKNDKTIRITRIHLEEDTARLTHGVTGAGKHGVQKSSLVDFNRSGVPLMELVTEPDFETAEEVVEFAKEFQLLIRTLGVSNADMEKGQLRIEANTSIAKESNGGKLGTKVEVKNLNSFQAVMRATTYEIERQSKMLDDGKEVKQETRGWDENKQKTVAQRSKEDAHDYRYFPEPDLPPMRFDDEYIQNISSQIGELPQQKRERFATEYNLSPTQIAPLVVDIARADFFEKAVSELRALDGSDNILMYNYLMSDVKGLETDSKTILSSSKLTPTSLAYIVRGIEKGDISSRVAKDVLKETFESGVSSEDIIKNKGLEQVSDPVEIENVVKKVIDNNSEVWYAYRDGKTSVLQFLIGKVMAEMKGRSNPQVVKKTFEELAHK